MKLTKHFTLEELTRSATADSYRITNNPTLQDISNLIQLCKEVLEPLREHLNTPIVITSGYRSPLVNKLVGGVANSQHQKGEAVDIRLPKSSRPGPDGVCHTDLDIAYKWINWLVYNVSFDQCILETANQKDYWLHLSCRSDPKQNRHQVITHLQK